MTPYILTYLSVGLAFFAWLFVYRMERYDLARIMDKAHLTGWERWGAWMVFAIIYAVVAWPIAVPLTFWRS